MISVILNKTFSKAGLCSCLVLALGGCVTNDTGPAPVTSATSGEFSDGSSSNETQNYSGAPDYRQIQKGSYTGTTYQVKDGETLFYIAYISGRDFRELASANNIAPPFTIYPGQLIRLSAGGAESRSYTPPPTSVVSSQSPIESNPVKNYSGSEGKQNVNRQQGELKITETVVSRKSQTPPPQSTVVSSSSSDSAGNAAVSSWRWPVKGTVINSYSSAEGGNKGIDIAGRRGEPIYATAPGKVVYAGNALRGYGNLIIIKHNDDYLSAYAHNDTLLVKERQDIKAGEQIATMGSSGASSVRLHFEIRYKGKSVNPLGYLPKR